MDYGLVRTCVDKLASLGWTRQAVAEADGYPIYKLERRPGAGHQTSPSLLIAAGIHGEEPAAVLGLIDWLNRHAAQWTDRLALTVFPCLNPWGFERGIRYDPKGNDLNRQFDRPTHPAVAAFCREVAGMRFDLFMDMHEDCDFHRMYLYEVADGLARDGAAPTLGRRILETCSRSVELSDGEEVGELLTNRGIVSGALTREELRAWDSLPIALYAFLHHTDQVITVETPGMRPVKLRSELHVTALEVACAALI